MHKSAHLKLKFVRPCCRAAGLTLVVLAVSIRRDCPEEREVNVVQNRNQGSGMVHESFSSVDIREAPSGILARLIR
jgi:hypothetical protein